MKLLVDRKYKKSTYTIGNLYVDGKYFSNTLEDRDRGLKQTDPLSVIKSFGEGIYTAELEYHEKGGQDDGNTSH